MICKNCGTPATFDQPTPPSPTPHLYRKIQAPDQSEGISLRKALRDVESDLREIDNDITRVQAVLEELHRKREARHRFTIEHDAFLAPVRRLPPEILAKIFVICMPSYGSPSFNPQCSPFLFGQVCIGWRQVALLTQTLWSSITVNPYWPSHKMAALWVSRAMSAPLEIRLNSTGLPRAGAIQPAISVLALYCDRWKDLDLRIEEKMVLRLNLIRHRLPWLETLRIQNPKASQPWCRSQELNIFELAPRLRNLSLGIGISHTSVKIPWHQLTELKVHVTDIIECMSILRLVPNVVKCTMYALSRFPTTLISPENMPILTLSHLHSLGILRLAPPEDILRHLYLPIIDALHIENERTDSLLSRESFTSFLSGSSRTLRKLEIGCLNGRDSAHIAQCLRATPSLTELTLRGSGFWVTTDLLRLLTRLPDVDALVPDLEALEISDRSIPFDECVRMIESRWSVATGAQVKKLSIKMVMEEDWRADVADLKPLLKCRQEGMMVSVLNEWNKDLLTYVTPCALHSRSSLSNGVHPDLILRRPG